MTKEVPIWLQGGTYPARLDRYFVQEVMRGQNRVFRGLLVSQRAAGSNFTIDVSPGAFALLGTSQADQGMYFARSTAIENVAVPATPGAPRTDTVVVHVNDPNALGAAGNNWTIEVIAGGSALPTNSLALATIARTASEPSILAAAITDVRPLGEWAWTVSNVAPGATRGVPGDLWVVCP